jgi:hypothetical protein
MRLRMFVAAAVATGLTLAPSPAGAKGAKEMTLVGPGLQNPIRLANNATTEIAPNLIVQKAGLFDSTVEHRLAARPPGRLGPRYVATYRWLVGPDETIRVRQMLYPFADGGAVSHMSRDKQVRGFTFAGGWYQAGPELTLILVASGVPVPEACGPSTACAGGRPARSGRAPSPG